MCEEIRYSDKEITDIFGSCPECKASWKDGEYSKVIGIEYPDKYDGTYEWLCPFCNVRFVRTRFRNKDEES